MIGIEFLIEERNLSKIFENVLSKKYDWTITQQEILHNNSKIINLNPENLEEIFNELNYVIELNIQAFLHKSKKTEIITYEDFINSSCQILILIFDGNICEIYFKNDELKNQILKNINSLNINYEIKTLKNDSRTKMFI